MSDELPETADGAIRGFIALFLLGAVLEGWSAWHHDETSRALEYWSVGVMLAAVGVFWVKLRTWAGPRFTITATHLATDFRSWIGTVALILMLLTLSPFIEQHRWPFAAWFAATPVPSADEIAEAVANAFRQRQSRSYRASERVVFDISFVQSEGKLVNIAAKMFRAGVVIDADQAAFENRENAFNSVGGHVVSNILASAMVDSIMAEARAANGRVYASFVGMQGRSDFDVLMNSSLNCFLVCALDRRRDRSPAALAHSKNGRLADRAATHLELLVFVLVRLDPTDIGFVDFNNSAKLLEVTAAGFAKSMQKEPT